MKLDHTKIQSLIEEGKSYKEIVEITAYNRNSVYGWCLRHYGKLADKLKSRRQSIDITQEQKEYLFGTLLGDGSLLLIGKYKNTVTGRTNHSIQLELYCKHKLQILNNLSYTVAYTLKLLNGKSYKLCYFCFKPNTELLSLYNLFYINNKKDVPKDLSLLTPKALAWWFMDDGTASSKCSISIATCSFSLEGLLRLKAYLKTQYNLDVTILKDFKLYFSAESARKFYNLTKDYIIDSMKYKFKFIIPDC